MEKRRNFRGQKSISYALDMVTKPIFKKRGFAENKIITQWPMIVGEALSNETSPKKLVYRRDSKTDGILYVDVYDSGMAMEMTYMEPMIVEKIASYFGYRAVAKLKIMQNPGGLNNKKTKPDFYKATSEVGVDTKVRLQEMLADIDDEELKNALSKLGESVYS